MYPGESQKNKRTDENEEKKNFIGSGIYYTFYFVDSCN